MFTSLSSKSIGFYGNLHENRERIVQVIENNNELNGACKLLKTLPGQIAQQLAIN